MKISIFQLISQGKYLFFIIFILNMEILNIILVRSEELISHKKVGNTRVDKI